MAKRLLGAVTCLLAVLAIAAWPALAQEGDDERYQALFEKGIRQLEAKDFDGAIETFKQAIEIRKDLPAAYYNVACAYSLKGDKKEALDWFEEALARGFKDEPGAEENIAQDKDLDPIRNETRFKEIMARAFPKEPEGPPLVTLKGDPAPLEKLKGKVVIVDIWRTWCRPCTSSIPNLVELQKEYGPRGLVVVGISSEPAELQEKTADQLKITYTLLRQVGPLPKAVFGEVRDVFPTIFILDREGKVVKKLVGARDKEELEALIKPLLGPEPAKPPEGKPRVF